MPSGRCVRPSWSSGASRSAPPRRAWAALGSTWEPRPTGRPLLDLWCSRLGKAERLILTALADAAPGTLTKQEVADRTGYAANGGGFGNALGRLRTLELVEGYQELQVADVLVESR